MILSRTLLLAAAAGAACASRATAPHVVFVLADDYGWANIGYHSPDNAEVRTPVLDSLAAAGVKLERHYAYKFCSPTRSSLQTGRYPVHVNDQNAEPTVHNAADAVGGYAGIPVNMTGLAQKMRAAGYRAHMTGKWDAGMATARHTPLGRGYESWLGYFHHANDYYKETLPIFSTGAIDVCLNAYRDLWQDNGPAPYNDPSVYEEELFLNHTLSIIDKHDPAEKLFMFHAFHLLHTPLQVPEEYLAQFPTITDSPTQRKPYAAMAKYMDDNVGEIVRALQRKGMWEDTLFVFSSDNGGPIYFLGGANNYPLKGGKMSDWEGGVRVNAFVSGGYIPEARRGATFDGYMHVADWYVTLAGLAGVAADDDEAAGAGLPGVDGIDQWAGIVGEAEGARTEVHLSDCAYIEGEWKIVGCVQTMSGYTEAIYPRFGLPQPQYKIVPGDHWEEDCTSGCLFNIIADPLEKDNLAAAQPAKLAEMMQKLADKNTGNYRPDRGAESKDACHAAQNLYGGFYGPFVGVGL